MYKISNEKTVILIQAEGVPGHWNKKFRFWVYRQVPFMKTEDFHEGNLIAKGNTQNSQIGVVRELLKHLETKELLKQLEGK